MPSAELKKILTSSGRIIKRLNSPTMWIMKEAKTTHQPQPPSGGLTLAMLSVSSSLIGMRGGLTVSAFSVFVAGSAIASRQSSAGPRGLSVDPAILTAFQNWFTQVSSPGRRSPCPWGFVPWKVDVWARERDVRSPSRKTPDCEKAARLRLM